MQVYKYSIFFCNVQVKYCYSKKNKWLETNLDNVPLIFFVMYYKNYLFTFNSFPKFGDINLNITSINKTAYISISVTFCTRRNLSEDLERDRIDVLENVCLDVDPSTVVCL